MNFIKSILGINKQQSSARLALNEQIERAKAIGAHHHAKRLEQMRETCK